MADPALDTERQRRDVTIDPSQFIGDRATYFCPACDQRQVYIDPDGMPFAWSGSCPGCGHPITLRFVGPTARPMTPAPARRRYRVGREVAFSVKPVRQRRKRAR